MRSSSASCISGLPAEMVLTSIHSALRAMSDASAMTSGEDARSSRRNSFRASLSPASAFSERALSSVRRPLASSESSSAPCTSPLSFAFAVPPVYQVGYYEYLCRVRKLLDQGYQTLQPLQLRPLSLSLRPSVGSPEYVSLGGDAGELPRPAVDLPYLLAVADAAVVVEPAVPALKGHVRVLLQSRGIRKNVVHTNLRRRLALVVLYERPQGGPVPRSLTAMEGVPFEARLLPALLLLSSLATTRFPCRGPSGESGVLSWRRVPSRPSPRALRYPLGYLHYLRFTW